MMETIDCRGLRCPAPLIKVRSALAQGACCTVLIDNATSFGNVSRFLEDNGYTFSVTQANQQYTIVITARVSTAVTGFTAPHLSGSGLPTLENSVSTIAPGRPQTLISSDTGTVVVISAETMGGGSDELGRMLIQGFLSTLGELDTPPSEIIFYNSGVLLAGEGAATVPLLQELATQGIQLTCCGACVDYYGIHLAVGKISNMFAIVTKLTQAQKILKP